MASRHVKYFLIVINILISGQVYSQSPTIVGKVFDKETQKPIPGVRVTVANTNRGTYSTSAGFFRITNVTPGSKVQFRSIGYRPYTLVFDGNFSDTLKIFLTPSPIKIGEVEAIGDIEVNDIIKRALKKKQDNLKKLRTLQAKVYSKLYFKIGGFFDDIETNFKGSSIDAKISTTKEKERKRDSLLAKFFEEIIAETFSNVFIEYEKNIKYSEITERRQTANFPKEANILVLNEFLSFYEDKVKIFSTEFVAPLAQNCFDYYQYELLGKELFGDLYVYTIRIKPKTNLYPLFEGVIKILEKNYNLLELELAPSQKSSVDFLDSLKYSQKFTAMNDSIWQPSFLEVKGKINIQIVKGIFDFTFNFRAVSIVSDAIINQPLPDSILYKVEKEKIAVSPKADSTKEEFWSQNSLVETSNYELSVYKRIDSLSKQVDTIQKKIKSNFDWGINILSENIGTGFNRVTGYSLGLSPFLKFRNFSIEFNPFYSFGREKLYFSTDLKYSPNSQSKLTLSIFSDISPSTMDNKMPLFLNNIFAYIFHWDYYDYFFRRGYRLEYSLGENNFIDFFNLRTYFEHSEQSSLSKINTKSLFTKSDWRNNPSIDEGKYNIFSILIEFGNLPPGFGFSVSEIDIKYRFNFQIIAGTKNNKQPFGIFYPSFLIKVPTFFTGYEPMTLSLLLEGGYSTSQTPVQYCFRMPNFFGLGNFYTAPTGFFGGNRFYALHFQYDFSDLWWRVIRLPLINKRGISLQLSGAVGYYDNYPIKEKSYKSTEKLYTEFGFGVSRIPIFVSNLAYWGFEIRYNTSKHFENRWGLSISLSTPFGF